MIKTWTENEVAANIAEAVRERDEWRLAGEQARKSADDWSQRWILSLAVGNGAGVAGITSLMNRAGHDLFALVTAGVLFAIGLLVAAALPFARYKLHFHEVDLYWALAKRPDANDFSITENAITYTSEAYREFKKGKRREWLLRGGLLQVVATAMFCAGLTGAMYAVAAPALKAEASRSPEAASVLAAPPKGSTPARAARAG